MVANMPRLAVTLEALLEDDSFYRAVTAVLYDCVDTGTKVG
jgi:hypothetical protein